MGREPDPARTDKAWEELYMTSSLMRKAWEMEVARVGLTLPQALVLHCLERSAQPPTLAELAQAMNREPHGVSTLITRMEADGFVAKKRSPRNARLVRVSMTKKGQGACRRQLAQTAVRDVTRTLSDPELDSLHSICGKIRIEAVRLIREMRPTPYDSLVD